MADWSEFNHFPTFCLGEAVKINTTALRGQRFLVDEIRVWSGESAPSMLDHVLVNIPRQNPPRPARLRVTTRHRPLTLTLYDDLPFNEGLENVVRDATKKFIIGDADPRNTAHEEFWRVNDVDGPHDCNVTTSTGDERNPKPLSIQYWDYSRLIDVEGIETEEFIYVERNAKSGWFQIWRGIEVAFGQIVVLRPGTSTVTSNGSIG